MFAPPSANKSVVRCDQCPGRPILRTHNENVDSRKCVRCQGEQRWLPQPHPDDHLCSVCARECPRCQATTDRTGQLCRACRGICRTCMAPLPERDPKPRVTHIEPAQRKDRKHRWRQTFYERTWDRDQCDACRAAAHGPDPVAAVLAAFPAKLVRACGGGFPHKVYDSVRDQLDYTPPAQLAARIDRRWWRTWATLPLERQSSAERDGYRPDDVALRLLEATSCPGRCEDGWLPATRDPGADDRPCPHCRGGRPITETADSYEEDQDTARRNTSSTLADRTIAQAVAYRPMQECTGKDGTCGVPVQAPHTQCPACADWPTCGCGRRRYHPDRSTACHHCTGQQPPHLKY